MFRPIHAAVVGLLGAPLLVLSTAPIQAAALPAGFQESVLWGGGQLTNPSTFRFAPDGRVFVAEKSGIIKVFDGIGDPTPTVVADLRTNVHNFWDRGLLGLEVDPGFPQRPYLYVLYTYDAEPGGTAPRWGLPGATSDSCPNPPGATTDGCVVTGRLSRLTLTGDVATGETVLLQDWCQQYPSHSIGDLAFGRDGALYVSGGDGASFTFVDWGQGGGSPGSPTPRNPCGDPPGAVGAALAPPGAEGGALRSQDALTGGDPLGFAGAVLRVDPDTGAALPDNPRFGGPEARLIAFGLRNPFRIAARPGTDELWLGDVGWSTWEEVNRIPDPRARLTNFGWPCYEGAGRQGGYDAANLALCEGLYASGSGAVQTPFYAYAHGAPVVGGEACPTGTSSISGLTFYAGGGFPASYQNALFFADYSRRCIWVMFAGSNGVPDPAQRATFVSDAAGPVDLRTGPDGALYYVDLSGSSIRRITYNSANQPPAARFTATPESGAAPLTVAFDARASSDPDPGDTLTFDWDLDGDGTFGDAATATPSHVYEDPGRYTVQLRVTDPAGAQGAASRTVVVSNSPPELTIDQPPAGTTWRVGDSIAWAASAFDEQDGELPDTAFTWVVTLFHCFPDDPTNCHEHVVESGVGADGSFTAPDHEFPSHLELTVRATDSNGLTAVVRRRLDPRTMRLTVASVPPGLTLAIGESARPAPWTRERIVGGLVTLGAPSPQRPPDRGEWHFAGWSDGGAASHLVTVGESDVIYTATYAPTCGDGVRQEGEACDDGNTAAGDCCAPDCTADPEGAACDDGDACTTGDACVAGACRGAAAVVCQALDGCHAAGVCDPATGLCTNPPLPDGSPCDDGNACTQEDGCQAGVCVGAAPRTCPPPLDCHAPGGCDPATGACASAPLPDGSPCDDGDACTRSDACREGRCVGAEPVTCGPPGDCQAGVACDPATGACVVAGERDGTACDDGDACTIADECQGGVCRPGTPLVCQPLDDCHAAGVCDPATGVCSDPPLADGGPCDDRDACTTDDACRDGVCTPAGSVACPAPDDCHEEGACDPQTGGCTWPAKPDGAPCENGDACTTGDACLAGACGPGPPVVCAPLSACHGAGVCDPVSGACSTPPLADGTPCDDGDDCTPDDRCQAGACLGGAASECAPPDACQTRAGCDPATGACRYAPAADGAPCDDGDACTGGDACQDGACVPGPPRVCDGAADPCRGPGVCDPATGACDGAAAPDGTPCDDGDPCTAGAVCRGGRCEGSAPLDCTTSTDPCHLPDGACVPGLGCVHERRDCDDQDPCTADTCAPEIGCVHTRAPCRDDDPCTADACDSATGACVSTPLEDGAPCDGGGICRDGRCEPEAPGDTCSSALPLTAGVVTAENLALRPEGLDLEGCPSPETTWIGRDAFYAITPLSGVVWELRATPAPSVDVRLARLGRCADLPTCEAGADDGPAGTPETLRLPAGPPRTTIVVVSAAPGTAGPVELLVTAARPGPPPDPGRADVRDGRDAGPPDGIPVDVHRDVPADVAAADVIGVHEDESHGGCATARAERAGPWWPLGALLCGLLAGGGSRRRRRG
jgi:cysteine-rich repeat protein